MAEVVAMRNVALPYPIYGCAFTIVAPLLDADGDPISPSTPDSEVSKNGDTFADCTNEATEIATSSGVVYLTLTAAEMTADVVTVRIQSSGAKTTIFTLYPRKLAVLSSGTCQGSNDTGDIQLASGDSAIDDIYNGCLVVAVIDGTTEARIINDYVGSTKVAEISPAWNTAQPDSNDTYTIYQPEGRGALLHATDVRSYGGSAGTFSGGRPEVNVSHWLGTAAATPTVAGVPEVDVTHLNGVTQSLLDLKDFADDGYDPSTNKVQGVVLVDTLTTYTGNTVQTGDSYAIVNSGTHGNAAIKGFVDDIGTAGAGLTAIPWNASWDAEVQSEVQDAIEVNNLDHLVKSAVDTNFATTVHADSVIGQIADNGAGFDRTTDSLEAIRDRGDAAWTTAAGFSTHSAADVWAVATRVLTAGTNIVLAKGVGVTGFTDISAAQVNAEVVDALATDTYAEPSGAPGATVALTSKIGYLYMALRNKITVTSSSKVFFDDGGASEWSKALSDDGVTYTEAEGS